MIGIAVELLISYLLLSYFAGANLSVLGIYPTRRNLRYLLSGFLVPCLFLCALYLTLAHVGGNPYRLNPAYGIQDFFNATLYLLRAVVYEELIFRGALLYLLIKWQGSRKAILLSAACFGIYHWFSYSILGQIQQMGLVFIMTGAMGYLLATAFYKTKSMILPFALHFGNNFAGMVLFSRDKSIGLQMLLKTFDKNPTTPGPVISIILMILYYIGVLLVIWLWFRRVKMQPELSPSPQK